MLAVNGSITSSVNVNNGVLTGTGAVGATKVGAATLAPGQNGFGTLTVNGSLMLQSASLYLVSVNATTSGRTNVTGTATVGGTVVAAFQGSSFQRQYTILSAASINGQFSSLITLPAMFNASLQQTATEVDLIVNSGLAKVSGLTGNQQAVANALDNAFNSGQGTLAGLTGLSPSQFAAALSILSGEGLSGTQESALGAGGLVLDTLQQQALDGLGGDGGGASASASAQYSASGSALGYAAEKKKHKDVPAVLKAMPLKAAGFRAALARLVGRVRRQLAAQRSGRHRQRRHQALDRRRHGGPRPLGGAQCSGGGGGGRQRLQFFCA